MNDALRIIDAGWGWRIVKRSNDGLRERGDGIPPYSWYVYRPDMDWAVEIVPTLREAKWWVRHYAGN